MATTGIKVEELESKSKDYAHMWKYWNKVEPIIEGLDSMKEQRERFLPRFPDESDANYNYRLGLAKLTNICRDVSEGLSSKPFEEEITLINNDDTTADGKFVSDFIEDVDGRGNNLSTFSSLTFFNGITNAIDWIFVDFPTVDTSRPISREQAKQKKLVPYWTHVLGKNVFDIRTKIHNSKELISFIKIFEPSDGVEPDKIRIFERNDTGLVTWKLYKKDEDGKHYNLEKEGKLSIQLIPFVPFITGRRNGNSYKFYPAMSDAVDLQITLYQNETALEYIKTMTGYPMLAANGMSPQKDASGKPITVAVGPNKVLYGPTNSAGQNGEWKYIEPSANSLEFLQKNIDRTKQDLRELGRQPLTALSTQLTTTTTAIAAGKAKSAVTVWALSLKDTLENCLKITMLWLSSKHEPEVNVFTGFDDILNDGTDITALLSMRQNGDLSRETLYVEMKRRKVLSPEFNFNSESERILNEIPSDEGEIQEDNNENGNEQNV